MLPPSQPSVNGTPGALHIKDVMEPQGGKLMPIAIIGLAGRFPGEATSPRNLWDMCYSGKSAWSEVPAERFTASAYFHPNPSRAGCFNSKGAHFLKQDVGLFDAPFFGISPNEAKAMDPQQRLLLETTYEALENAGIGLEQVSETQTGVYVGASSIDYTGILQRDVDDIPIYQATGTSANILSNRISYVFNLKGTSITMDTACSSSLVALHIACNSLRSGENTQAIVCGSHIMLSPDTMVGMSMLRLFGEEGKSYTYDSRGTGYGRGEGVASVLLKPLQDAIRDGDHIRAVIRNTGANQDGRTNGITFPSKDAQARLMRSVYDKAGLDPFDTDYVEAHGTGTAAGDPVEAEAISSVFGASRTVDDPLLVGSVKTNIGHLEAASGLAAVVKSVLALEHQIIPPNINFENPNKDIPLQAWRLKVPTSPTPWQRSYPRRASISNFGFGGTNVHVILEQYENRPEPLSGLTTPRDQINITNRGSDNRGVNGVQANGTLTPHAKTTSHDPDIRGDNGVQTNGTLMTPAKEPRRRLFIFSASDKGSLKTQMHAIATYLDERQGQIDELLLDRLSYTLGLRRSLFEWRAAVSATTGTELRESLLSSNAEPTKASDKTKIAFVFTGQGSQWYAMGRELLEYPIFRDALHEADQVLRAVGAEWSLLDELAKDAQSTLLDRAHISQPATTAIQIALVSLLASWNIKPSAVVGHSSGEIGAAYAAGALSLKQCMQVSYHRGALAANLKGKRPERPGAMLAIGATSSQVQSMIKRFGPAQVVLACHNGPSLVTVSGDSQAIAQIQNIAEDEGLLNRRLKVDVAYHSPHMQDIAEDYLAAIKSLEPMRSSSVQFFSSVIGRQLDTADLKAAYWVQNMTHPVRFVDGIQSMYTQAKGPEVLVEIGPHSTLKSPIQDILKSNPSWASDVRYLPSLVRNSDASATAFSLAAALHALGCGISLLAINNASQVPPLEPLHDLPSYPWNHAKKHWHESRLSLNHRLKRFPRNDLLGSLVDDMNEGEPRWRNLIRLADVPWLAEHTVQGSGVFPATGYLSMALEATSQYNQMRGITGTSISQYRFRNVKIARPMMLSEEHATEISFTMRPQEESRDQWMEFAVSSWSQESGWTEHCRGLASIDRKENGANPVNGERYLTGQQDQHQSEVADFHSKCNQAVSRKDVYAQFSRSGLDFGPTFQNFQEGRASKDHAVGTITVADTSSTMPYGFQSPLMIHPTTFDACLQVIEVANAGGDMSGSELHVPTFFKQITIDSSLVCESGARFNVFAKRHRPLCDLNSDLHAALFVTSATDETKPLIQIQGFVGSLVPGQDSTTTAIRDRGLCYRLQWQPCLDTLSREEYTSIFTQRSSTQLVLNQIEELEKAAFHYIKSAFQALTTCDMDIPRSHLREYHRVLSQLLEQGQHGALPFQTSGWLDHKDDAKAMFLQGFVSNETARMVQKIGENLASIITGKTDPLSMMVQDNGLSNFYRDHEGMKMGNASCANMVATLAHQKPNMRILEIGAGTGATTTSILLALGQDFSHYDFTDVSVGFFDRARKEQARWSDKMDYRKLDIEQDPAAQGFEPEAYDLIIAVNVLHATAHMDTTMRNTRALLRPGGKAVIAEITGQLLSSLLVFGTLPGWWLGEEPERRDGPFLAESAWDAIFRRTGFSGLDGSAKVGGEEHALASVMITSAAGDRSPACPTPTLIRCNESQTLVCERLSSALEGLTGSRLPPTKSLYEATLVDTYSIVLAMEDPILAELDEAGLHHIQNMFCEARGILWVTRGARSEHPEANMVTGFARSFRGENAGLRLVTLDLDGEHKLSDDRVGEIITRVFRHIFGADVNPFVVDTEFVETHGILHVGRLKLDPIKDDHVVRETYPQIPEMQPFQQPGRLLELAIGQVGLLDSIYFQDKDALASSLQSNQVEISVQATGLNFKEIMIALGQIPFYHPIGLECSGIVVAVGSDVTDIKPGTRVCAFANGAFANTVRTRRHEIAVIPDKLDFPQAASMPVVFGTAHFALSDLARLSKGESILIHAAAGGVGQAAIMLAQHIKAVVYVTVGSVDKKRFIMQTYNIPETHIFSSRDTSFQQELKVLTEQRGVDVVLNSTAGEMLHESWQCLAPLGRFIEIGKRDLVQNASLAMDKFLDSVTFCSIDLSILAEIRPSLCNRVLTDVVNMYNDGVIRPISPITIFPMSDLQQAMRQMQAGKHTGKLVIDTAAECLVQVLPARSAKAIHDPAASYIITGGTGGLGRSITRWLSREGARNIILLSRSGTGQKGVAQLVEEQQQQGTNVVVRKCDVADAKAVHETLIECSAAMPPIKGVIHGAMALHDALFEKITFADWQLNTKPRVQGARNLHRSLQSLNSPLDFFIMLASSSGITGPRGQTAYAASNTFLDSFVSHLRHHHRPPIRATAIDIGIVSDVGYVAENVEREAEISVVAPDRLSEAELLALVKGAITGAYEGDGLPQQTYTGLKLLPDKPLPFFSSDPKFAHLVAAVQGDASCPEATGDEERLAGQALHSLLKNVSGADEAVGVVSRALVGKLCSLLMIGKEDVSIGKPVVAYGLDSLVAVELRNWITVDLEATVSLMDLMNSPSIEALAGKIAGKSKLVGTAVAPTDEKVMEKAEDSG